MKVFVYAVYDSAAGVYRQPFFLQTDQLAQRAFKDIVLNPETDLNKHPKDFTLFRVGIFDDNAGALEGEVPVALGTAQEVVKASRHIEPGSLKEAEQKLAEVG